MNSDAPCRILIVDDSPEDREVYKRMLSQDRQHAYEFLEADLGEEGLRMAEEERPDCLLLDYKLPDVDGLEFLSRLTDQKPLPVIIVTDHGHGAVAVEAFKGGAPDYLLEGGSARARLTIERNSRAQAQLIADLLDVSRIITGKLRLDCRPVELARIIGSALDSVRPAADAKAIHLALSLQPLASPVLGDSDRLQQV